METLDILLIIRACAENYPPTVNQANLLARTGLQVGLIDLTAEGTRECVADSVRRYRIHRMWNSKLEPPYPFWKRWVNWVKFHQACQRVIYKRRPRVVMAYDILGCGFARPDAGRHRTVYHFHELPEPENGEGWGSRIGRSRAAKFSRQADVVVFSDASRARLYKEEAGLNELPRVVMNCPVRMETIPLSPLVKLLSEQEKSKARTVCYLGSIGKDQGIVEAAASMRFWPSDTLLVLIGPYSDEIKARILMTASQAGSADRVVFVGAKPHSEALALAAGANIGISLVQPNTRNWLYSAGAINKRFEYMALGLPQVTNDGPGVADIVEANHCGVCVNTRDPAAVGAAVGRLLDSPELRRRMSQNARTRHLENFNYETQFAGIAEWIQRRCSPADAKKKFIE
jgi:glycosyltransferase involved in cell wall biosynthesis